MIDIYREIHDNCDIFLCLQGNTRLCNYKYNCKVLIVVRVRIMMFCTTFKHISVVAWWSVLLVEERGVPGENHWPVTNYWKTWLHDTQLYQVHLTWTRFELKTLVVIGNGCTGSWKSNYHMITTITAPPKIRVFINYSYCSAFHELVLWTCTYQRLLQYLQGLSYWLVSFVFLYDFF